MIKTIKVYMKHDDRITFTVENEKGDNLVRITDDYMPYFGILGGDGTRLTIDNETGRIIGWKPITNVELESLREGESEEDNYEFDDEI